MNVICAHRERKKERERIVQIMSMARMCVAVCFMSSVVVSSSFALYCPDVCVSLFAIHKTSLSSERISASLQA